MTSHATPEQIIDFLHGELPAGEDAMLHAHLATCEACRAEYEAEASLGEVLRAAATREEAEFPSVIAAAVWQQIREAQPGPFARLVAAFRPAIAMPIAAALLLGTFLATPALQHLGSRPSIDAAYYFADHAAQEASNPFAEHSLPPQAIETSALEGESVSPPASLADAVTSEDGDSFTAALSGAAR